MHARYSLPVAVLVALAASASAFAQGTAAPRPISPEPRWYVAAIGGAVSRPPTAPVFGVEVAEHLGEHAQAYVTFSYIENLMRETLRDDLDLTATRLEALTGESWSLSGRDRGVALVVGGKYVFGSGAFRPYVGGGGGVINLKRTVFETRIGDVTRAVYHDFDSRRCGAVRDARGRQQAAGRVRVWRRHRVRPHPHRSRLPLSERLPDRVLVELLPGVGRHRLPVLARDDCPTGRPGVAGRPSRSLRFLPTAGRVPSASYKPPVGDIERAQDLAGSAAVLVCLETD